MNNAHEIFKRFNDLKINHMFDKLDWLNITSSDMYLEAKLIMRALSDNFKILYQLRNRHSSDEEKTIATAKMRTVWSKADTMFRANNMRTKAKDGYKIDCNKLLKELSSLITYLDCGEMEYTQEEHEFLNLITKHNCQNNSQSNHQDTYQDNCSRESCKHNEPLNLNL